MKNHEWFQQLFDASPDPTWIIEDNRFVECNEAALKTLGYVGREELLNLHPANLSPPTQPDGQDSFSKAESMMAIAKANGLHRFEWVHKKYDGSEFLAEVTLSSIVLGCKDLIYCAWRDITERKHLERLAEGGRLRLQTILKTASDGIHILDADGILIEANDAFLNMLGYDRSAIGHVRVTDWDHQLPWPDIKAIIDDLIARQGKAVIETRHRRRDGVILDVEIGLSGIEIESKGFVCGAVRDISNRKQAEEEQRRLARALRLLSDCNLSLVHTHDEPALLSDICRLVVQSGGYLMTWIGFAETDTQKSVRPGAQYGIEKGYLESIRIVWDGAEATGRGPVGVAIRTGTTQVIQDTESDPIFEPWREAARQRGYKSLIALPLSIQNQVIGSLTIYADKVNVFAAEEVALLEELARNLAFGIDTLRLRRQNKAAQIELAVAATAFDTQEGTMICNAAGVILRVNQAFARITGYSVNEAVGQRTSLLKSDRHDTAFYTAMWESISRQGFWKGEIWNRRKNGEVYPEWLNITAVRDVNGTVTHYVGTFSDITQRKEAEDQINELAYYDPLTGIPNRRLLTDRLRQAVASTIRSEREGALLFVDLDHFKALNDTQGHDKGDLLLREVARRLTTSVREADTVARLGGDEFVLILADLSGNTEDAAAQAEAVGEKIISVLGEPYLISDWEHRCTPSIGITLFGRQRGSIEELMKQADIAMYQAKAAGRNTWRFFDPTLQAAIKARVTIEQELLQGIKNGQFVLHYQPQIKDGRLTGAEALIRWRHPDRGLVYPGEFIPLAEETGMILDIGHWVLETACRQIAAWTGGSATDGLTVAVNVSPRQFNQPNFVGQILTILDRSGADPRKIELELTESMLVAESRMIRPPIPI